MRAMREDFFELSPTSPFGRLLNVGVLVDEINEHRDSVSFVTLPLDHANDIFPGTLERANEARQELLWTLADADEVQ